MKRLSLVPLIVIILIVIFISSSCESRIDEVSSCPISKEGNYDIDLHKKDSVYVLYRIGGDKLSIGDGSEEGHGIFDNSKKGLYINIMDSDIENTIKFEFSSIYNMYDINIPDNNGGFHDIEIVGNSIYLYNVNIDDLHGRIFLLASFSCN